jgi:tetratricopeptide (TPR) repeat protein
VRGARARHVGDPGGDLSHYLLALDAFERAGDARNACNTRVSVAFAYIELGEHEAAKRDLEAALALAERLGLGTVAARARHNLGLVLADAGRFDEAREVKQPEVAAWGTGSPRREFLHVDDLADACAFDRADSMRAACGMPAR